MLLKFFSTAPSLKRERDELYVKEIIPPLFFSLVRFENKVSTCTIVIWSQISLLMFKDSILEVVRLPFDFARINCTTQKC